MSGSVDPPSFRIRVIFGPGSRMGPGKADLLEGIGETGSIAAAGRRMGMSYKRAWQLAETMNSMFRSPLIESSRGGPGGGGARLTDVGRRVLDEYRALERAAGAAGGAHAEALRGLLRTSGD
ncbi:winged helix-turn-helix domain-containing protein [Histidinibacterium aquaticum]|uniref:LysR family transcriptional regulator n=1 Tax=Histidinibacterium aquaticum TaxID=2613962 RepID=A0A5J5GQE7_9RHOB|nr:LysR family transcriptional regulator [Histidinibacterium aquaticum]KAA9010471.1 LysR family transcriptional regulator [Histidinibacterium aquaticum]